MSTTDASRPDVEVDDTDAGGDGDSDSGGQEQAQASPEAAGAGGAGSRQWRAVWRIHFYSGIFALPFILLMAVTGLVILYTQPIQDWIHGDLYKVDVGDETVSYEEQAAAVEEAFPEAEVISLTTPSAPDRATIFGLEGSSQHTAGDQAFVNPYTGEVLGANEEGGTIVGLSNRLHGFLNIEGVTVDLPTVSALWDDGAVMREYVLFDLVLETFGVWVLVLVFSGLFLYWPRRSRAANGAGGNGANGGGAGGARPGFLRVRRGATGRARWRDLHGLSGFLLLSVMVLTIISGLAWSTYWGTNFAALADNLTPGQAVEAPPSEIGTRGDLDRLGNHINWNTGDFPIPASYATDPDGETPAPMRLNDIVEIAEDEGMKPGYTVYFPTNVTEDNGETAYGSFTVSNSWPRKTGEARDLYLDQFTGETLDEQEAYGYGTIGYGMDTLVSTHMGTQLGLFSRIMMTVLCVLAICSVSSALVMYTKRRRPGTAGLPRRPADVRLPRKLALVAGLSAVVFPHWGVTALAILGLDRFVVRRVPRLRTAFGQR
jgi:uncharacterized iron-regulated membrane protein